MYLLFLPCMLCMLCHSHVPWFAYQNNIQWKVQIVLLLAMQFSPSSCHLFTLSYTNSPQHCSKALPVCVVVLAWDKVVAQIRSSCRFSGVFVFILVQMMVIFWLWQTICSNVCPSIHLHVSHFCPWTETFLALNSWLCTSPIPFSPSAALNGRITPRLFI